MQIACSFFGADVGKAEIVVADYRHTKPVTKTLKNTLSGLTPWLESLPGFVPLRQIPGPTRQDRPA